MSASSNPCIMFVNPDVRGGKHLVDSIDLGSNVIEGCFGGRRRELLPDRSPYLFNDKFERCRRCFERCRRCFERCRIHVPVVTFKKTTNRPENRFGLPRECLVEPTELFDLIFI